jgi:diguanylate cyclase (GGDEF)-like protein
MTYAGSGLGLLPDERIDLSERIIRNEEENGKSLTDPVTGLGNLRRMKIKTDKLIEERADDPAPFTIGVFDIDRFRPVNDLFGRKAGDEILSQVALRISAALPEDAALVRIAGDTFGMVLPTCFFEKDAERLGKLLKEVFTAPFDLGERTVRMTASFGFCQYPFAGSNFDELYDKCESALYQARKGGPGSVQVYTHRMAEEMRKRTRIEQALRKAIAAEEIDAHFQPIVDVRSGAIRGFECLARWTDPELGSISPAVFIPLAEQAGFIDSLTKILFLKAIETAKSWPKDVFLSFNLSSVQLMDPTTGLSVMAMLSKMDFDPRRIEIEITETGIMSDPETAERIINEMRAIGIRILLDDFGTGQSSLGRLRDFSFDKVKIDRSFIAALGEDTQSEHIVTAILSMCKALELSVIAEGIETAEQAEKLVELGCIAGQGYFFGRPADAQTTLGYFRQAEASEGGELTCRTTAPGCCAD